MQTSPPTVSRLDSPQPAGVFISVALACALFSLVSGTVSFWHVGGPEIWGAARHGLLLSIIIAAIGLLLGRGEIRKLHFDERGIALGLLLFFFSDSLIGPYSLVKFPGDRGLVILGTILGLLALRRWGVKMFPLLACISVMLCALTYLVEAQGRLLISDDNSVVLYRLMQLKENFPSIPFYTPFWNAGVDARDFFATGAFNIFFLFAPLIYAFDVPALYSYLPACVLFLLLPLSVWAAASVERLPPAGQSIAVILAITASLTWYKWGLKYGTLGFAISVSLFPLVFALSLKLLDPTRRFSGFNATTLIITGTLMLFWSPSGIMILPVLLIALFRLPSVLRRRWTLIVPCALVLINLPWILLFWRVSNVSTFVKLHQQPSYEAMAVQAEEVRLQKPAVWEIPSDTDAPSAHPQPPPEVRQKKFKQAPGSVDIFKALQKFRETANNTNPLILLFLLPGIFRLRTFQRFCYGCTVLWLAALGTVFVPLVPQLELDRMLVVLSIFGAIPAGHSVARLLLRGSKSNALATGRILPALALGFLFASLFATTTVLSNRSVVAYAFAQPSVFALADQIRTTPHEGRILFSGFVLHELNDAHLAPLATFTRKPLIASSPFHDKWWYEQVIPESFLALGDQGIERFMSLRNVGTVIAHEEYWQKYFLARPHLYTPRTSVERWSIFDLVAFQSNYFLEGSGTIVEQSSNAVRLTLTSADSVIKFNYLPFLRATTTSGAPCRIEAASVSQDAQPIRLIALRSCPLNEVITVDSSSPLTRFLLVDKK